LLKRQSKAFIMRLKEFSLERRIQGLKIMPYILAVAAIIIIFFLLSKRSKSGSISSDHDDLLNACGNDTGLVERLIKLEIKRKPTISRSEAITRALNSYRRDRGV